MKKLRDTKLFEIVLDAVQSMLGPFFIALLPAMYTVYVIYFTLKNGAGPFLALFYAGIVGIFFETIGIISVHIIVAFDNAWEYGISIPIKFKLIAWLVPTYIISVATSIYLSEDAVTPVLKWLIDVFVPSCPQ